MLSVALRKRQGDFALDLGFEAPTPGVIALFGRSLRQDHRRPHRRLRRPDAAGSMSTARCRHGATCTFRRAAPRRPRVPDEGVPALRRALNRLRLAARPARRASASMTSALLGLGALSMAAGPAVWRRSSVSRRPRALAQRAWLLLDEPWRRSTRRDAGGAAAPSACATSCRCRCCWSHDFDEVLRLATTLC
jgi:hypothetical protein